MQEYRTYTATIYAQRAFVCSKDEDAITRAKQLVDGHPVELWSGQRLILRIERKSE